MRRQSSYSRRQFFRVGAAGVATTMVVASGRGRGVARAAVQSPPPMNTAPRVLRKPPLDELGRIAKSYGLDASAEDLASFRDRCRASRRPETAADEHGAASLAEVAARRARAHREVVWPGRECRGPRVAPQPDGR